MRFFLHHRKFGTLTTVEVSSDRIAKNLGAEMETVPYVVEIRYQGISEYQGFHGITDHYSFVQPDAVHY